MGSLYVYLRYACMYVVGMGVRRGSAWGCCWMPPHFFDGMCWRREALRFRQWVSAVLFPSSKWKNTRRRGCPTELRCGLNRSSLPMLGLLCGILSAIKVHSYDGPTRQVGCV
jgi:hypothetical protein